MIVAAYSGCGKTYWAAAGTENSVDIPSMPYRWILPEVSGNEKELEKEKGAFYHVQNPAWPLNYVKEILLAEEKYDYVIIPSIHSAMDILSERFHRKVCLVYPDIFLKEEYRKRYILRNNSDSFMSLFLERWDENINGLMMRKEPAIVLQQGQYLTHVKNQIDCLKNGACSNANKLTGEEILLLKDEVYKLSRNLVLYVHGYKCDYALQIPNIDSSDQRKIIYDIGRCIYEKENMWMPQLMSKEDFDNFFIHACVWIKSEEELMEALT